jgi:class I fructose-bisphosphate aldolase
MIDNIAALLGDKAEYLLKHSCQTVSTKLLHLPGPDWVDRIFAPSNRNQRVLNNLNRIYRSGRLAGTGYLSILRSIKASSTRPARASQRTRNTSIRRTL